MFNTTTIHNPTRFIEKDVHEHRAPTDASVRLLREMEKEAVSKTLSVHRLKNNVLDAVWHIRQDPCAMEAIGHCKLILNGKTIEFQIPLEIHLNAQDQARSVLRAICEKITQELVANLLVEGGYQSILLP